MDAAVSTRSVSSRGPLARLPGFFHWLSARLDALQPLAVLLAGVAVFGNGRWALDSWLLRRWPAWADAR